MLKFSASLEELVPFLSQRLNDEAEIDIMIDQNKNRGCDKMFVTTSVFYFK